MLEPVFQRIRASGLPVGCRRVWERFTGRLHIAGQLLAFAQANDKEDENEQDTHTEHAQHKVKQKSGVEQIREIRRITKKNAHDFHECMTPQCLAAIKAYQIQRSRPEDDFRNVAGFDPVEQMPFVPPAAPHRGALRRAGLRPAARPHTSAVWKFVFTTSLTPALSPRRGSRHRSASAFISVYPWLNSLRLIGSKPEPRSLKTT